MSNELLVKRSKLQALLIEREIEISYLQDEIEDISREIFQINKELIVNEELVRVCESI